MSAVAIPIPAELPRCPNEGCGYALIRGACPICGYPAFKYNATRVPSVLPLPRLDARRALR